MFIGFRINHRMRFLEAAVGTVAFCGLLTPGGRSLARGIAKGTVVAAKEVHQSWRMRRDRDEQLRSAAQRDEIMRQMYERDHAFRAAVDKAFVPQSWWSRSRRGDNV